MEAFLFEDRRFFTALLVAVVISGLVAAFSQWRADVPKKKRASRARSKRIPRAKNKTLPLTKRA